MTEPAAPRASEPSLLRSAGVVSIAVACSRITGLVRESVLSALFGAGAAYDAYVLGFRIPNLARDLFAEGALSSAFVPAFTRHLAKSREDARELADVTATALTIIVSAVCLLGIIFSPAFVSLFAPGFHEVPGKFDLAVTLVRVMFPFLLLVALAAQAQGILNANHQFAVPAFASSLFNVGSVVFGLLIGVVLGPRLGISRIHGMAWGVLCGGAAQLAFQLPALWRAGFVWRPRWNLAHPGLHEILRLMGPAVIGSAALQINLLVNTNIAAGLRDASGHTMNGPVSWLAYSFRFMQLPMGLFGVSVASAALPRLSRNAASGDAGAFSDTLRKAIDMILLLTVPSSVGLMVLGRDMIALVYQHGHFLAADTAQTAAALSCYAAGLSFYALTKLLAPAFYALGDARIPALAGIASVAVNAAASIALTRLTTLGHAGLALSVSFVSLFQAFLLLIAIRSRIPDVNLAALLWHLLRIAAASLVMGIVCAAVRARVVDRMGEGTAGHIAAIALVVPVGAGIFFVAATILRVAGLREIRERVLSSVTLRKNAS